MIEQYEKRPIDDNSRGKKILYLLFSVIIGIVLIAPRDITWARDRMNYLVYADYSWDIMQRYISNGIFSFFSNEPLFLGINALLSQMISAENIVRFIIFISTIGVLYSLGKLSNYNFFVLFFFLFVPQILKNHIIHLRQGLGLSVYLLGLVSNKKYGKILRFSSMFIHTSFVFLILFEGLEALFRKSQLKFSSKISLSIIFLIVLVIAVPSLASYFGDRRVLEYSFEMAQGASGFGFILWLMVGSFFILIIKKSYINIICCYGIFMYIISYFSLEFGARIFENIIPLILVGALTDERKEVRIIFIVFFVFFGAFQWYSNGINFLI
ncbi:EpsG family protein [Paenibacillus sp. FSL R10-2796]|uniref:EpsG family protein n=1 Tax=Paenibacillus sp. FSL R10-2796 TaxID=2954663 RepID=UPI0030DB09B8